MNGQITLKLTKVFDIDCHIKLIFSECRSLSIQLKALFDIFGIPETLAKVLIDNMYTDSYSSSKRILDQFPNLSSSSELKILLKKGDKRERLVGRIVRKETLKKIVKDCNGKTFSLFGSTTLNKTEDGLRHNQYFYDNSVVYYDSLKKDVELFIIRTPEDQCPICLNYIFEIHTTLSCRHSFHTDCISSWLEITNTCPFCRMEIFA